jgi:hypothetical protein
MGVGSEGPGTVMYAQVPRLWLAQTPSLNTPAPNPHGRVPHSRGWIHEVRASDRRVCSERCHP